MSQVQSVQSVEDLFKSELNDYLQGFIPRTTRYVVEHRIKKFNNKATNEMVDTLEGVVISSRIIRRKYENNVCTCYSSDGNKGINQDGIERSCKTCPDNQFGENRERKVCKEKRRLRVVQEGALLPVTVDIPPTSLKNWDTYVTELANKRLLPTFVVTKLSLVPTTKNGYEYCNVVATKVRNLSLEEAQNMVTLKNKLGGQAYDDTIEEDEVETNNNTVDDDMPF